jgi:Flp pilus assembly protein CpaB
MNKRTIIASVVALLITVIAMFLIFTSISQMSQPKETVEVAVAKQEIMAGTILQPDMYEYVAIPKDEVIPSYVQKEIVIVKDKNGNSTKTLSDMLKGKEAKENIYKGERIIRSRVSGFSVQTGDGNETSDDYSGLRRMTYTAQGIQNLAGQLKAGDYIDFWIRYKLQDKENSDTIVVVDKILSNVPVVKALDSNAQEIKSGDEASTTIEIMLSQEQIQEFIKWRDLGKITLVKVPVGVNTNAEKEVTRVKMSMNDLIWDVLSMTEDKMNKDDIVKDNSKKGDVGNYHIPENTDGE